jgi:hypothetical protein
MSIYWDRLVVSSNREELEGLLKKVDVMTVLSGICIDLAKKLYELDIEKEIRNVERQIKDFIKVEEIKNEEDEVIKKIKKKPNFFQYISESHTIKDRILHYDCPMDFLFKQMSELPYAKHHKDVDLISLIVKYDIKKGNRKQEAEILQDVKEMCKKINDVHVKYDDEDERNNVLEDIVKYFNHRVEKKKVKSDTMYAMLVHMIKNKSKMATKLLNVLYSTQKEVFLTAFKAN